MNHEILSVTTVIITAGLSSHIILRDEYKLDLSFSSVPPLLGVETSLMYEVGQSLIRDSNSVPVKKYKFIYIFYRERLLFIVFHHSQLSFPLTTNRRGLTVLPC